MDRKVNVIFGELLLVYYDHGISLKNQNCIPSIENSGDPE